MNLREIDEGNISKFNKIKSKKLYNSLILFSGEQNKN